MNSKKFDVSPCFYAKRAVGMTDYTKSFLEAADKNANFLNDDREGPGLDIVPKGMSNEEWALSARIIQDQDMMKRIVRYTLLSKDEQKVVAKELRIIGLK